MLISIAQAKPFQRADLLWIAAWLLIGIGVFFRLYHPESLALSDDEVITSMHVVGLNEAEVVQHAADLRTVSDLQAVLHPAKLRSYSATIDALKTEDPQHPPLYYLAARAWVSIFDTSRQSLRTLSAVFGLLALPCMFWLCMELFRSSRIAWVGTALLAVSPVNVLYSHEIREYSLWVVAVLATSALFIKALRSSIIADWLLYAVSFGMSLYIFPGSIFVGLGHLAFAFFSRTDLRNRIYAMSAIAVGCLLFAPWLIIIMISTAQISQGMNTIIHASTTPVDVLINVVSLFKLSNIDLNVLSGAFLTKAVKIFTIVLVCYALFAIRSRKDGSAIFVWCLVACATLPFVLPDFIWTGTRSSQVRYFLPFFIGVDLALAALICATFFGKQSVGFSRRAWQASFALVIAMRIFSCWASLESTTWWSKFFVRTIEVASVISTTDKAVLISDDHVIWPLALSEYLDLTIPIAISPKCYLCSRRDPSLPDVTVLEKSNTPRTAFLLGPSDTLQAHVRAAVDGKPGLTVRCIHNRDTCASDLSLHY